MTDLSALWPPGLTVIRAKNASPLTGSGTNTYLLGQERLAIIDPGPDLDSHLQAILDAAGGRKISHILVTHAHHDHSGLAPRLAIRTGAEVLAFGTARDGTSLRMLGLSGLPSSGEGLDLVFRPDRRIADGAVLDGPDWSLQALHTPGHLGGHLCFAWGDMLFSGDHVMGWATSVVSPPEGDMSDYMASLHRLGQGAWRRLYPGHGDPVVAPAARIAKLISHRLQREAQILAALALGPATPFTLTARLYQATPRALWPAAERNILAHLIDLEGRNMVCARPHLALDSIFHRQ